MNLVLLIIPYLVYMYSVIYLEARNAVQARIVLNVSTLGVEARSMPGAPHTPVAKVTLDQGCSVVSALVAYGGKLSILPHNQRLQFTQINLSHSTR